jgi:hypothetical protein
LAASVPVSIQGTDPVPTKINDCKSSTILFESYPKKRKNIFNLLSVITTMVMYFSVKKFTEPLVVPNKLTLNCPLKNSTLNQKNSNAVSRSDRNLEFYSDLLCWSGYKSTNVWAGPDPDHGPPAATDPDPDPDQVPCTDPPKAICRCGPDMDSEPLLTSGSDPGPGPVLDRDLYFCLDPYSGWRELSLKFYSTLNRPNHKTQGIIYSNYSYLTQYLRRSRDMDELDEYMRWLEGDDGAMDNIRNQTPTEPPAADDTPAPDGGDPAPRDGGEEEEVMVLDPPAPDDTPAPTSPGHTSSSAANTKVNDIKDNNSDGSQCSDISLSSQDTAGTFCTVYSKYGTRE